MPTDAFHHAEIFKTSSVTKEKEKKCGLLTLKEAREQLAVTAPRKQRSEVEDANVCRHTGVVTDCLKRCQL